RPHAGPSCTGRSASLRTFMPIFDGSWTRVNALMTRASIPFARRFLQRRMDCRVKPGNDLLALTRMSSSQPLQQVIAHPDRVGNRGERRIDRADADEKARVYDIKVVELMRLTIEVEHGALGIAAEPAGASLMGAARDGNIRLHIQIARNQMMMHAQ